MRRHAAAIALTVLAGQLGCETRRDSVTGHASGIVLNRDFVPLAVEDCLNARYNSRLFLRLPVTNVYLIRDKRQLDPDTLCLYPGDLRTNAFVRGNGDLLCGESGLRLFRFWPDGLEREFGGGKCLTAGPVSMSHMRVGKRDVLLLDQEFDGGGSGGQLVWIVRHYMAIDGAAASVTREPHVITRFSIGYPRLYGGGEWSKGAIRYSHDFDIDVSPENGSILVEYTNQRFELVNLFESEADLPKAEGGGLWGEGFTFTRFELPRRPELRTSDCELRLAAEPL